MGAAQSTEAGEPARIVVESFIDGVFASTKTAVRIPIVDPGNGSNIGEIVEATDVDVVRAVSAARRAHEDRRWSGLDPEDRQKVLFRLADLVEINRAELVRAEALDTGKPLAEAELDIAEAAAVIRYYAGWADKVAGTVIPGPRAFSAVTVREPVGVCAAITPWNYPLPILTYKVGPALAFGNTVVAKPSEVTSVTSVLLAQLASKAGVPDGVFNVVVGGRETGTALSSDPGIDKLGFTGSTATGRAILRAAAEKIIPATVELGGKSAQLVFPDADIEAAVEGISLGIWTHAGQICVAGSRVLVHESIADEFLERLKERSARYVFGHALDPKATLGPLVSATQHEKVSGIIESARASGVDVFQPPIAVPPSGYFFPPTILSGMDDDHDVVQEEIFGPVVVVQSFSTEDEAVARANGTDYGLAAGIWTRDVARVHRVSDRLESGSVWINDYGIFHPAYSFGGVKASGFGRELGEAAIEHYTRLKTKIIRVLDA